MRTLMHLATIVKMSVVKRICQNMFYDGEVRGVCPSCANQAKRKHFALNCRERIFASSKSPKTSFTLPKVFLSGSIVRKRGSLKYPRGLLPIIHHGVFFAEYHAKCFLLNCRCNILLVRKRHST